MGDLYRMYGANKQLLYVGISGHAGVRATQHAEDKPWWPQVKHIDIEHLSCPRDQLLAYEKRCIQTEKPLYNVQHNVRDDYTQRLDVRPFAVHRSMVRTDEWRALSKALADLVPLVRRKYGAATLTECVLPGEFRQEAMSLLELIDCTARAAHIPTPCRLCGGDAVAWHLSISYDTTDSTIDTSAICTSCEPGFSGHRHLTWEKAL
jgi:hypothetical protein